MFAFWLSTFLTLSVLQPGAFFYQQGKATTQLLTVQEFDAFVQDWKQGQELALRHPLFDLTRVSAGSGGVEAISFAGVAHGQRGDISLVFYTMDGDQVYTPPGTVANAHVDERQKEFHIAAVIPRLLQGRTGVVQVTFQGEKRAAYLLKVQF
ncbi:hypothetical protein [Brevibacillus reuszeri]|uniref:hypothetical protein n=1 Tax=Brevibacillus reuszeri TaxID=54915 RepID=UPI00289828BF|nr:hypothetical protein [Brevibacillus reuszeri]